MKRYSVWLLIVALLPARALAGLTLCCSGQNDLYRMLEPTGAKRFDTAKQAIEHAPRDSGLLILADEYPKERTKIDGELLGAAKAKGLRVYVEFPAALSTVSFGEPKQAGWERVVVDGDVFGGQLPNLRILGAHNCTYLPTAAMKPFLSIARVAGFDRAAYGLPPSPHTIFFELEPGIFVATTKLSDFVTARYAPAKDWKIVWQTILQKIDSHAPELPDVEPIARPAFGEKDPLPADAEKRALDSATRWILNSRLLLHESRRESVHKLHAAEVETAEAPPVDAPVGDGSCGILEGYASQILPDGSQLQRTPIRADCCAESAMVLAMSGDANNLKIAANLLEFTFGPTMQSMGRSDPKHPAFGLIAWGAISPAWQSANYGDDNARAILATLLASASMEMPRWDKDVLRALFANLRTTGTKGFRGDRVDIAPLEKFGWKHFHDAETVNIAPHFECGLWTCYLWAYRALGEKEFLAKPESAIRATMAAYPNGWRFGDTMEKSRMLMCLAWLVRADDTPEHRQWLARIADDVIALQTPSGAIRERLAGVGGGHYKVPQSNEAYGTGETPLIQSNDDIAADQLYANGFAFIGLHEAAAATGDAKLKAAEDKLAEFLCRIQTRSAKIAYLDGWWFRAFDVKRWEYWSSSADIGWGAWSLEAGWGQAWTAATFALREKKTSMWEMTSKSKIAKELEEVRKEMD